MVFRLMNTQQAFLDLMDKLFPRKTLEQMLEQLTPVHGARVPGMEPRGFIERPLMDSLALPIAELTSAVQSLTKWKQDEQAVRQRMTDELSGVLREEFTAPMNTLNASLHDLVTILKDAHSKQGHATTTLAHQRTLFGIALPEGRRFWPKRSMVPTQRPTA
jgi:hypothetical protein